MVNIWLHINADLSTLDMLFTNARDMGFLKILPEYPKLQIIVIFVSTDVAVFPALELSAFLLLCMAAVERWMWMFFCYLETGQIRSKHEAPPIQDFLRRTGQYVLLIHIANQTRIKSQTIK
jgi:hypothetical protein